ncbi:MFS transporter [Serratia quinivorans]|uniref:MFS transporter n=1 Tax=Serratia quinivorans TaxID=137545 RepID=UPI00217BD043|nr:MFS transporter [Serratia quinivorans]CAI1057940.1 Sugar efflux transporter A [Serratia quinivorans]CAI1100501.1 Sugar efflux transporter A [Serratia quinivorans]CAI1560904.1 Sugar efflux transporter A [Serratia quinivorans]CAI2071184.1 Sugar efflux transporter A [Serratia quinivorans]CAI2135523.1 Sugar efflux transporter A [Serratia quinivorans]
MNSIRLTFMVVAFFSGIAGALQIPTLSLFLTTEVRVTSLWVGFFYAVNAGVGIIVSFLLAKKSDRQRDRRHLILICYLLAAGNCLLFAFNRNYLTLITAGVLLTAIANTAIPQLFALAREYGERSSQNVAMFSAIMRAQLSLAWVFGPPLAFMLVVNYGFTAMFMFAAGIFLLVTLLAWWTLPEVARQPVSNEIDIPQKTVFDKDISRLFFTSVLMWTCSAMYLIDVPLYITAELGLPQSLTGWMMGIAAAIEIPIMILVGRYVNQVGKRLMMAGAMVAGILFYAGMLWFTSAAGLLVWQLFNAIFIGIIATVGMLYFQDLMPERAGMATTLFTNSISTGVILAGILQGILTEYGPHSSVYLLAILLLCIALPVGFKTREV